MIQITPQQREQFAWAAGIMDGEGSITAYRRRNQNPISLALQIGQSGETQPEVLRRLAAIFPKAHLTGPYKSKGQPRWAFALTTFEGVQDAICKMWPWLSEPKKQQIRVALQAYHSGPTHRTRKNRGENR